jgi:hypothetical protein
MLSCLASDLSAVFSLGDFAERVTLNGGQIAGHFDDEDIEANMGEGPTQIVPQPKFTCRSADATGIEEDQFLWRGTEQFRVKNWKDDGVGVIVIYLERV